MNTPESVRQHIDALWQQLQIQLPQCDLRQKCALAMDTFEKLTAIAQQAQYVNFGEAAHHLAETLEKTQRLCEAYHQELQYTLEWASHSYDE